MAPSPQPRRCTREIFRRHRVIEEATINRQERRAIAARNGGWGPWEEGFPQPVSEDQIAAIAEVSGQSREVVLHEFSTAAAHETILLNAIYQVNLRRKPSPGRDWPEIIHLSIKRRDRKPLGVEHFRDLQRIKNELVGPEHEAVELYPAESRLVDTSNHYHLWVMVNPQFRFPFGYTDRLIVTTSIGGAVQRPFEEPTA